MEKRLGAGQSEIPESLEVENAKRQIIVLVGPEGSGKTTQANLLAAELGLPRVTMGDIFRELALKDTDLGRRSRELFEKHTYSDIELWRNAFLWRVADKTKENLKNGFILDGGFRFFDEVDKFDAILEEVNLKMPIIVVYFRISIWRGYEKLELRRRIDDTEEGIRGRQMENYKGLGKRMSLASKKWPFFIINVEGKSEQQIKEETLGKIKEVKRVDRAQ